MRSFMFIFLLFIFMSLEVANSQHKPPSNIVCYIRMDIGQSSLLLAANRSGFGVSFLLETSEEPISLSAGGNTTIGAVRGLALLPGAHEVLFATFDYDDGNFKGSISSHGPFSATDPQNEMAIVGGTHAFRRVQGYVNPSIISQSSLSNVVRWELHLFYPKA